MRDKKVKIFRHKVLKIEMKFRRTFLSLCTFLVLYLECQGPFAGLEKNLSCALTLHEVGGA